jgi:hypothetical protein
MLRRSENLPLGSDFDDLAQIHHRNPMGEVLDDREIVTDEKERKPKIALQVPQQVDDFCLDRHVERRNRLVAHDQIGLGGKRARSRCAGADHRKIRAASDRPHHREAAPARGAHRSAR